MWCEGSVTRNGVIICQVGQGDRSVTGRGLGIDHCIWQGDVTDDSDERCLDTVLETNA